MSFETTPFGELFALPQKNGLTRPKAVRGLGLPMVNMGELFAHPRIKNLDMDLVQVDDKEAHFLLEPEDLLFARQSLVLSGAGQCSIFIKNKFPTVFESHLIRCRLDKAISNPYFYFYFFRSPVGRTAIETIAEQGAGASGIRGSDLVNLEVPCPPKAYQDDVAKILTALDDRITLLRETNATLEAIAQALFKSWLVDFDPVRAKLEGRTPEGMDEATAALFPDGFEESELGLVPRGWRVVEIGSVADILNGFAFKSEDYVDSEDGVFVLRTTNFSNDGYATRLDKDVFLPRSFMSSHEKFLCQAFDFHLVMVGASVGHTSLLLPNMLPALRNQNMWCFRPKVSFPSKFFIHESVKINLNQALRGTSGSAREFLRKSDFLLNKVLLPSESLLAVFENHLTVLKDSIANNTHQSSTLVTLRDTLLPRLISGQLRLPEVS